MPTTAKPKQKQIEPYEHHDKDRLNNPPVGLVSPELDPDAPAQRLHSFAESFDSRPGFS
jgi:hypothetical protein